MRFGAEPLSGVQLSDDGFYDFASASKLATPRCLKPDGLSESARTVALGVQAPAKDVGAARVPLLGAGLRGWLMRTKLHPAPYAHVLGSSVLGRFRDVLHLRGL